MRRTFMRIPIAAGVMLAAGFGVLVGSASGTHENWKLAKGEARAELARAAEPWIADQDRWALTKSCAPNCKARAKKKRRYGMVCGDGEQDRLGTVLQRKQGRWKHVPPSRYKAVQPKRGFFSDSLWLFCSGDDSVTKV